VAGWPTHRAAMDGVAMIEPRKTPATQGTAKWSTHDRRRSAIIWHLPQLSGDKRMSFHYDYVVRRARRQVFAWTTDHRQLR
jgi:hypothetical protein